MSTAAQIKTIQTLRRKIGLEEPEYRGLLVHHGGKASSKDISDAAANHVIAELRRLGGGAALPKGRTAATTASGSYAPLLRALWIAGWNLGLVRSADDAAMIAFVARQTGVGHTRFLSDIQTAMPAIEGLKKWLSRDGGVVWPSDRGRMSDDILARKFAVCRAITARLVEVGGFTPRVAGTDPWPADIVAFGRACGLPSGFTDYGGQDWDDLANILGKRPRARLAEQARAKKEKAA